jgi:hypothetical protein
MRTIKYEVFDLKTILVFVAFSTDFKFEMKTEILLTFIT